MTPEQAIKLASDLVGAAFKLADHFGQRVALKARLRAEMADMFDEAEEALERKHEFRRKEIEARERVMAQMAEARLQARERETDPPDGTEPPDGIIPPGGV
jgi:hypothetical protein